MDSILVGQQLINGLVIGLGYALVAIGISLAFRVLDAVNFAHGDLYMLGGYFTFLVMDLFGFPYVLAGMAAVVLTAATAWVVWRTIGKVIRTDRENTLLATFAISLMIGNTVNTLLDGKSRPIASPFTSPLIVGPFIVTGQRAVFLLVGLCVVVGVHLWMQRSLMGKKIRATAENETGARVIGINVSSVHQVVFVGGAALAGMAGALLSPVTQVSAHLGLNALIKAFVVLVLGGPGNVLGAAVGGITLGIVEALAATFFNSAWKDIFGYVLLILVLLIQPKQLLARVLRRSPRVTPKKA